MLFNPQLLFSLHPARTVLQTFPGAPFISIRSRILRGSDSPSQAELVFYWGEGNTGSLQLHLPPRMLRVGDG